MIEAGKKRSEIREVVASKLAREVTPEVKVEAELK